MENAIELYAENGITLYDVNGVVCTTTESVAKKFDKRKGDVDEKLKSFPDYDALIVNGKIRNCEISVSSSIKPIKMTYIDRDIMTLLIMAFTGDKSYEWKKQYIQAFNLMEEKLNSPDANKLGYKAKLLSLETNVQLAKNELNKAKNEHLLIELQQQLQVAKLLGKSFDVNQYISTQKLTNKDVEVLAQIKTMIGSDIQEFAGIELEHRPMTTLLKMNDIDERVNIFNDYLEECGILKDRVVTDYGKRYGFNMQMGDRTFPRWYVTRFDELITLISNEGFID